MCHSVSSLGTASCGRVYAITVKVAFGAEDPFSARSVPEEELETVSRRLKRSSADFSEEPGGGVAEFHLECLLLPAGWRCAPAGWLGGSSRDWPNSFSRKGGSRACRRRAPGRRAGQPDARRRVSHRALDDNPVRSHLPRSSAAQRPIPAVRGNAMEPLGSTHSRPSALAVGTGLHASLRTLTDATRIGSRG